MMLSRKPDTWKNTMCPVFAYMLHKKRHTSVLLYVDKTIIGENDEIGDCKQDWTRKQTTCNDR